jgi:REP element-mobilizing transposase RayT
MTLSTELPAQCQQCARSTGSIIHDECVFCLDIGFREEVLCQLNRVAQDLNYFQCHAYKPVLRLVHKPGTQVNDLYGRREQVLKSQSVERFLSTDTIGYKKAVALQKLSTDPGGVFLDIKYHFAWNVIHRRPVFSPKNDIANFTYDLFSKPIELGGDFVNLLWLASDHIHLHVDSNGDRSVETVVKEIKRFSEKAIFEKFFRQTEHPDTESTIWDTAYFSETMS